MLVPRTTAARGSRFEVAVDAKFLCEGVFDAQNPVTIPHSKLVRRLGTLTNDQLSAVETGVRNWLGLS
jgi:mRNA interferase MazF